MLLDGNGHRLTVDFRNLRKHEFEHAVFEAGCDVAGVDVITEFPLAFDFATERAISRSLRQ